MRRKRYIGYQIVALIAALVFLCCMLTPCVSLTWRWEETDETPEPLDVAMNLLITQQEIVVDDYVEEIGHAEAASKWQDISFLQLAKYTWDAGFFLGDTADDYQALIIELNELPRELVGEQVDYAVSLAAACRFANVVAIIVSLSIYIASGGMVITVIYIVAKLLMAFFSEKMANELANEEARQTTKKDGKRTPLGAILSGYGCLLLCHHLFGFSLQSLQNIYAHTMLSGEVSSIPECDVNLVFSGGIHWLLLIIPGAILIAVGQFVVQKIFHFPSPDSTASSGQDSAQA